MTAPHRPSTRLFVSEPLGQGGHIVLSPEQAHYLATVMRIGEGEDVALFNGEDGEWRATVTEAAKKRVSLSVTALLRPQSAESKADVWLLFAPIKKQGTDIIVEKATELGASAIWPVTTQHTIAARVNLDRLHANAIEASEQCERLTVPRLFDPARLEEVLARWEKGRVLYVLDETGGGAPAADILPLAGSGPAAFLVGPEGGFSSQELDLLRRAPFVIRITLGPRILRAETAALAGLTCWQALCGDWRDRPAFRSSSSGSGPVISD